MGSNPIAPTRKGIRMYTNINFKTKEELEEAIKKGDAVLLYNPGPLGIKTPKEGTVFIEGPHYPEPHIWFAEVTVKDSLITNVV